MPDHRVDEHLAVALKTMDSDIYCNGKLITYSLHYRVYCSASPFPMFTLLTSCLDVLHLLLDQSHLSDPQSKSFQPK